MLSTVHQNTPTIGIDHHVNVEPYAYHPQHENGACIEVQPFPTNDMVRQYIHVPRGLLIVSSTSTQQSYITVRTRTTTKTCTPSLVDRLRKGNVC